jgi:hypothetical protein
MTKNVIKFLQNNQYYICPLCIGLKNSEDIVDISRRSILKIAQLHQVVI